MSSISDQVIPKLSYLSVKGETDNSFINKECLLVDNNDFINTPLGFRYISDIIVSEWTELIKIVTESGIVLFNSEDHCQVVYTQDGYEDIIKSSDLLNRFNNKELFRVIVIDDIYKDHLEYIRDVSTISFDSPEKYFEYKIINKLSDGNAGHSYYINNVLTYEYNSDF